MRSQMDTYKLPNGVTIPCLGFGTWQTPDGETAVQFSAQIQAILNITMIGGTEIET